MAEEVLETVDKWESLVQRVQTHLDWCKHSEDRRKSEMRWQDCQRFWLGDHWSGIKCMGIPPRSAESRKLHPNPVDNYFKSHIEGLVGDICDRPVDIQVAPREESDTDVAAAMDAAVKYCWYNNNGDRKLEFIVRRGVLHGPLIAKVYWDNSIRGRSGKAYVGDVRFIGVLPTNIFIDPRIKATEEGVIQDAAFVIYCVKRSLAYIREHYPERGHLVTADTYASYISTLSPDEAGEVYPEDQEVLLIEYWYKGKPLAEEFPVRDEPTFPREGWVHKAVVAGGVLLEHFTYVYPWYPFVLEWIYPSDESIYGYGDGHDILMPQLILNKLNEIAIEGADMQSQGVWLADEGNIRNRRQFERYARMGAAVLQVANVNGVRRELGGNVPASLFTHYRQELQAMETVSGRFDVAQGRTPRRIQAASAIALLLQQSGGRVRQRARAVGSFVQQIVKMMIDLIGKFYTEERLVRVVGKDGTRIQRTVSRQDFVKTKTYTDPFTGQTFTEEYIPEFDIVVTAGTETPTSRAYYSELAMELFKGGVIDDIALLDTLQFPRWRDIKARMDAKRQQAAAAAAAQQPGGPPRVPPVTEVPAMQQATQLQQSPMGPPAEGGGDIGMLASIIESMRRGGGAI